MDSAGQWEVKKYSGHLDFSSFYIKAEVVHSLVADSKEYTGKGES